MLLDRTHRSWALISAVLLAVGTVSYIIYAGATPKGPTGGSLPGLIYGFIGSLMMIFAGLLAGRRQLPYLRLGSAQFWLRGHLWLGTLSVPFILFHSGFGLGGLVEQLLWLFFAIVVLSGFFGLAMQQLLPRLLTSRISRETFRAQMPYVRKRNRVLSDKAVSLTCGRIPVGNDPLTPQLERLAKFSLDLDKRDAEASAAEQAAKAAGDKAAQKAAKELQEAIKSKRVEWTDQVAPDELGLFLDLARHSKAEKWIRAEQDLPGDFLNIYEFAGIAPPVPPAVEAAAPAAAGTAKKSAGGPSPLDQMKAKKAAGGPSPLEQMKAKKAAPAGASPLEMARAAGAKGGGAEKKAAKASPLEMARKMGAAGGGGTTKAALSPAPAAEAAPATAPAKKAASRKPEPIAMSVDDVKTETDAIRAILTEKYGIAADLAEHAAGAAEAFLHTGDGDPEVQRAGIRAMLKNKYGYEDKLASEAAADIQQSSEVGPAKKKAAGLSPLEAARAAGPKGGAAKKVAAGTSPLEAARAAGPKGGGAKKAAAGGSPLDAARAAGPKGGGAKKAAAGGQSPLEMMRAKAPAAGGDSGGGAAKKSPLDMMKAKAGGGAPEAKPAAPKAPAPPKKKAAIKRALLRTTELRDFYLSTVRPFLQGNGRTGRLADATEQIRAFSQMRATLPVELHDTLDALRVACEEQRQFAEHERIHNWLHYWLMLHIPFSMILFVLFIVHVIVALRVVPWSI